MIECKSKIYLSPSRESKSCKVVLDSFETYLDKAIEPFFDVEEQAKNVTYKVSDWTGTLRLIKAKRQLEIVFNPTFFKENENFKYEDIINLFSSNNEIPLLTYSKSDNNRISKISNALFKYKIVKSDVIK